LLLVTSPARATASYNYSLGVIAEKTGGSDWKLLVEISEREYKAISSALVAIARLDPPFHFGLVERNYQELQARHQFVTIVLSLGRQFASPHRTQLGESLSTSIVNWLTAMRLFLDHEETALKRRFGKESPQVKAFEAATKAAFDAEEPGYRFAYKFRNYVQHCGPPLTHLDVVRPDGSNPRAKQSVRQLVKRDELLTNFHAWGPVKKDLQAFPASFEVLPLIASAMDGIRDVQRACAEIGFDHALAQLPLLDGVLDRIESTGSDGEPATFRHRRVSETGMEVSPRLIPSEAVRTLQSVARGETDRDSLWATPDPSPLPLDPATIRKQFHRGSRGVQALAAWMSEGGGTPKFSEAVSNIIAEDRNIEPLITGLINVSGLLANVAAGAIGTSPEGLVGGSSGFLRPVRSTVPGGYDLRGRPVVLQPRLRVAR
jgi:hypothetical protein